MRNKLFSILLLIIINKVTSAQGKLYVTPQVFAFVGSYKGVDSVNMKQTFIKTRNFARKDFLVGINLSYYKEPFLIYLGIEQAAYATSFFYKEDGILYQKTKFSARNLVNYSLELKYDLLKYNKRLPIRWRTKSTTDKFLIVSKISPFIGVDYLRHNQNSVNKDKATLSTPNFNIPYELDVFQKNISNIGIRTGVDWTFYNGEKRKFILSFAYRFGLRMIANHIYHFQNSSQGVDFYYQTTTRGNGFSIKAGFPIKLFEINKKNKKNF